MVQAQNFCSTGFLGAIIAESMLDYQKSCLGTHHFICYFRQSTDSISLYLRSQLHLIDFDFKRAIEFTVGVHLMEEVQMQKLICYYAFQILNPLPDDFVCLVDCRTGLLQ